MSTKLPTEIFFSFASLTVNVLVLLKPLRFNKKTRRYRRAKKPLGGRGFLKGL